MIIPDLSGPYKRVPSTLDYGIGAVGLPCDISIDLSALKGGISIHPEPKHDYARIRTGYILPEPQLFEALDIIADHVKSWY